MEFPVGTNFDIHNNLVMLTYVDKP
jgi:hypothetical protein